MHRGSFVVAVIAVLGLTAPAAAQAVSCGDNLFSDTTLTADLTCPVNGVNVRSGVTLDLAGHTIQGSGQGTAIQTQPDATDITIKNGTVKGFVNGVFVRGGSRILVEDILTTQNSNWGAVTATGSELTFRRVRAIANGGLGIHLHSTVGAIIDSVVEGALPWNGLQALGTDVVVQGNDVSGAVVGITVDGTRITVTGNHAHGNRLGIEASGTDVKVVGNTADRNAPFDGFEMLDPDVAVTDNVARNNARWGIRAPGLTAPATGNSAGGNGQLAQCEGIVCTILDPAPSQSPSPLRFGPTEVGASSGPRRMTITNHDAIDLVFGPGAPALGGPHAADFTVAATTCPGQRLRDGQSCTVDVRFAPRDRGTRSAYVEFAAGTSTGTARFAVQGDAYRCSLLRLNASLLGLPLIVCL